MAKEKATIIKVFSTKNKSDDTESVVIVYRDADGNKNKFFVPRAMSPYYIIKDKESPEATHQPMFINEDKVEKKLVYRDSLLDSIAKDVGMYNYLDRCRLEGKDYRAQNLFKHPWIYGADMDVSDYHISAFNKKFERPTSLKLHKGFFDIEVDIINYTGFPEPDDAPAPVNIISYFDQNEMKFITWVLRNKKNPQIQEFEDDIESFKEYMKSLIKENDDVDVSDFEFKFFDDEMTLIVDFFDSIHDIDPDYMLAWNMSFDVKTMINRLKKNFKGTEGSKYFKALDIICNKEYMKFEKDSEEFEIRGSMYYKEYVHEKTVNRTDYFDVTDGTNWIDQMYTFANLRKGQGQRESYSLDFISYDELGKEKLEFLNGETIKNIPYKNFKKFVEYNIRDVLLLYLLEKKNLDMDMLHTLSYITNTRINKVLKNSISIKNFVDKFAKEQNLIMRDNVNLAYGDDTLFNSMLNVTTEDEAVTDSEKFFKQVFDYKDRIGAYVGDPTQNNNNGIELFDGTKSKYIFENVIDQDLTSLYPSIIISSNMDSATQIGKFFMIDKDLRNKLDDEYDYNDTLPLNTGAHKFNDMSMHFVDSLISQNWTNIGKKYFDLPSTEDMINDLLK
jgi:DNA polymerase elongation subunit (family B)